MYCSNCGNEVPDDAKTCPECGQDLAYESKTTASFSRSQKKQRKKKRKRTHHGLLALVLIALAGGAIFHFVKGPSGHVASSDLVPAGPQNAGGVTNLLNGSEADADSAADSAGNTVNTFLGDREPTPTATVTPIDQMPETKAKVVNTPTPTPSIAPSASPSVSGTPSPSTAPSVTPTASPTAAPRA